MNQFKQMMMSMNGFRLMLFATFVAAVTVLISGLGVTYADQAPAAANQSAAQPTAAQKAAADAVKARAMRDAAIKKRHESKKYIQNVIEGQQPGPAATAPANAGQGGAK
ncbi:MAG: hypothetical protein ABSA06_05825 [Geobacteraceae bacterium]|jgi:Na+-translocating ferredoxin:NAD+ oxidoreductase RnfG subunit